MKDAVSFINPVTIYPLTSKSQSFTTDKWAINNNANVTLELHTISSSGLSCTAKVQGSLDGSSWFDIKGMQVTISGNDDVFWSLSHIDSVYYLRVSVTIIAGSAIFNIQGRAT